MDEIDYFKEEPFNMQDVLSWMRSKRNNDSSQLIAHNNHQLKELNKKVLGLHKDLEKLIALMEAKQKP